jgi:hypothetical protein
MLRPERGILAGFFIREKSAPVVVDGLAGDSTQDEGHERTESDKGGQKWMIDLR